MEYLYQKDNQYFGQIAGKLETEGIKELKEFNITKTRKYFKGVYFRADNEGLYRANYNSRLFTRILAPLIKFKCHNTKYLYRFSKEINWEDFLSLDKTFAIFSKTVNSKIKHSQYAALCLKDAIVDFFNEKYGERPNVEPQNPDLWINLHIENDLATISIDTSGGSLHRRGYRVESVEAPMQETLAAALVRLSGWDFSKKLIDPFCGSGTILAEALMQCSKVPASYLRKNFGFMHLPDFDKKLWEKIKNESDNAISGLPENLIYGSDIDRDAINAAKFNMRNLPFGNNVNLVQQNFEDCNFDNSFIITNPPYGIRLENKKTVQNLYTKLSDRLMHSHNTEAVIYVGDKSLKDLIKLKPVYEKTLVNGALNGSLLKYEID